MTSKLLKKQGYGYVYSRKELYSCPLGIVTDVLPDNPNEEVQTQRLQPEPKHTKQGGNILQFLDSTMFESKSHNSTISPSLAPYCSCNNATIVVVGGVKNITTVTTGPKRPSL